MPQPKELDERMTMNVQSWKKKHLITIAESERISYSRLLLKIVDAYLEARDGNGGSTNASTD